MTARDARGRFTSATPSIPREPADFPAVGSRASIHWSLWLAVGLVLGWLVAAIACAVSR